VFTEAEEGALLEVLRSGSWGGYSKKVEEFEKAFAALRRVPYSISCSNGTVALEVALRAAGVACGDEVVVAPFLVRRERNCNPPRLSWRACFRQRRQGPRKGPATKT
jgi:hypothetical protein